MITLEITDETAYGTLAVDLRDFLTVIGDDGAFQEWRIESLEAVAKPSSGLDILALERQVTATAGGSLVEWRRLRQIAEALHQTINCRIVGSSGVSIEAQDTTRWVVSCRIPEIVARIRARFERVREVAE